MENNQETNSVAHGSAETTIHIYPTDLEYVKKYPGKSSNAEKLHMILSAYKHLIEGEEP